MSVFRSLTVGTFLYNGVEDAIVAKASGTQTNAYQLSRQINRIATCATAGDSVKLPPAQSGLAITIINHGATSAQVYGSPGDTINDVASATGVPQMANSVCTYHCLTEGSWYAIGLSSGFAGGLSTRSSVGGLTALVGGGQTGATPLTAGFNIVANVASAADSVLLPVSKAGMWLIVKNTHANSLAIFPNTGETINAIAADAVYNLATVKTALFFCVAAGAWHTILTA
jgi:hypothetical protein